MIDASTAACGRAFIVDLVDYCDQRIAALGAKHDDASLRRVQLYADIAATLAAMLPKDRPSPRRLALATVVLP